MKNIEIHPCRVCGIVPTVSSASDDETTDLSWGKASECKPTFRLMCEHSGYEHQSLVRPFFISRLTSEATIEDWNNRNPLHKRTSIRFTAEERAKLDDNYERIRSMVDMIKGCPLSSGLVEGKELHIWKRLEQLTAMSFDDLMDEIEADYVLFYS